MEASRRAWGHRPSPTAPPPPAGESVCCSGAQRATRVPCCVLGCEGACVCAGAREKCLREVRNKKNVLHNLPPSHTLSPSNPSPSERLTKPAQHEKRRQRSKRGPRKRPRPVVWEIRFHGQRALHARRQHGQRGGRPQGQARARAAPATRHKGGGGSSSSRAPAKHEGGGAPRLARGNEGALVGALRHHDHGKGGSLLRDGEGGGGGEVGLGVGVGVGGRSEKGRVVCAVGRHPPPTAAAQRQSMHLCPQLTRPGSKPPPSAPPALPFPQPSPIPTITHPHSHAAPARRARGDGRQAGGGPHVCCGGPHSVGCRQSAGRLGRESALV